MTHYSFFKLSAQLGKIAILFSLIVTSPFFLHSVSAQLPPTIHRISYFDTEIDGPIFPEKVAVFFTPSFDGTFGTCWNTTGKSLLLHGGKEFTSRPLTLLAHVKMSPSKQFNIICAADPKSSATHWEIFTTPEDGKLGFYIPGCSIETFLSDETFADGIWHYLGMFLTEEHFEIYSDGQKVLEGDIDRPSIESQAFDFALGGTVEQNLFSSGEIDEFLLRRGNPGSVYSLTVPPKEPFTADSETILLLHFESDYPDMVDNLSLSEVFDKLIAPQDMLNKEGDPISFSDVLERLPFRTIPVEGIAARQNEDIAKITLSQEVIDQLFTTGGTEIDVPEGWKPAKNIEIQECLPETFNAEIKRLGVESLSAEMFRPGVFSFWGEQYVELSRQISGEIPLPRGAEDQVFDTETLVKENEQTPAQIVIRRAQDILNDTTGTFSSETERQVKENLQKVSNAVIEGLFATVLLTFRMIWKDLRQCDN